MSFALVIQPKINASISILQWLHRNGLDCPTHHRINWRWNRHSAVGCRNSISRKGKRRQHCIQIVISLAWQSHVRFNMKSMLWYVANGPSQSDGGKSCPNWLIIWESNSSVFSPPFSFTLADQTLSSLDRAHASIFNCHSIGFVYISRNTDIVKIDLNAAVVTPFSGTKLIFTPLNGVSILSHGQFRTPTHMLHAALESPSECHMHRHIQVPQVWLRHFSFT